MLPSLCKLRRLSVSVTCWKNASWWKKIQFIRWISAQDTSEHQPVIIQGKEFKRDDWTNIPPKVLSLIERNLHKEKYNPLSLIRQKIVNYMYKRYVNNRGNPLFSVYDDLPPVVTTAQNFDSLLIPKDHPSRRKTDCYYLNKDHLLRAHTSAHQAELLEMGLNNFLIVGDVYRRDQVDSTHYPVFHQMEGVRICTKQELFSDTKHAVTPGLFEEGVRTSEKQQFHTLEATKFVEQDLKSCLIGLAHALFGNEIESRWVDTYFPFTHPSWELEINFQGKWMEMLGCGIIEQEMLRTAGAGNRIGWAFGLGLERLAMILYRIPDIRLFWSTDTGFLSQFKVDSPDTKIQYKPISICPQCINDISFWILDVDGYSSNDFYDLARNIGGDLIEQVVLIDEFFHPKKKQLSHAYRIVYRHMERALKQEEVNRIHHQIEQMAVKELRVVIR